MNQSIKLQKRTQSPTRHQSSRVSAPKMLDRTTYSIHAPYPTPVLFPATTNGDLRPVFEKHHAIVADGAYLDEPQANPWMVTGTLVRELSCSLWSAKKIMVQVDDGTWKAREQTPESLYEERESDGEVLLLDDDVMERDLETGVVGECGQKGCRQRVGCVDCQGGDRPIRPSPRTTFRENIARKEKDLPAKTAPPQRRIAAAPVAPLPLNAEEGYPKHLQRLIAPTVVVEVKQTSDAAPAPSQIPREAAAVVEKRRGPKIKYIRKRPLSSLEQSAVKKKKIQGRCEKQGAFHAN